MKIERSEGGLVADCDLFSTVDGRVVGGDDPDANALIARAGLPIPPALVESLGLRVTGEHKEEKETKREPEHQAEHHAKKAKE